MATMASNTTSQQETNAGKDVNEHYEALRNDVTNLADAVKRLAGEQIGTAIGDAQDKALDQINSLESSIRRNPTQAAMVAAGIGFLVGLVMLR